MCLITAPTSVNPAPTSVIPAPTPVIPAPTPVIPAPTPVIPAKAGIQYALCQDRVVALAHPGTPA